MTTAIYIVTCVFVFVFGSVIGSFLNVVIYRTPLKQSIITEPSHCFSCGHTLPHTAGSAEYSLITW